MGLIILDPVEGATVAERIVTVSGLAQPGAAITREIPFWFDDHTTADVDGRWSLNVELSPGWNDLRFRVGDNGDTAVTLRLYYAA